MLHRPSQRYADDELPHDTEEPMVTSRHPVTWDTAPKQAFLRWWTGVRRRRAEGGLKVPPPPKELLNITMWGCIAVFCIVLIGSVVVLWNVMSVVGMVRQKALPLDNPNGDPSVENLLFNTFIGSQGGVEILKKVLVAVSEQSDRVLLFDKDGYANQLRLDVSGAGEFGILWKYMTEKNRVPKHRLIVDIGAYDGVLGSNSYNLLQQHWDAILFEPFPKSFQQLQANVKRFPNARAMNIAIADWDGEGELSLFNDATDAVQMENTLQNVSSSLGHSSKVSSVRVKVRRASTMLRTLEIPVDFGILSVDAEGVGPQITKDVLDAGYRPRFIIFEWLGTTRQERAFVKVAGYAELIVLGFNVIYEYVPERDQNFGKIH